jgi:Ca2+-binding EF-hand superfamily protein
MLKFTKDKGNDPMNFPTYRCKTISIALALSALLAAPSIAQQTDGLVPPFQSFDDIDLNQSGGIDLDEILSYQSRVFAVLDENKDGSLTAVELGKRLGPAMLGFGALKINDMKQEYSEAWNVNGDDRLSKVEFLSGALSQFARVDQDGNNILDKDEYGTKMAL